MTGLYYPENARSEDQAAEMRRLEDAGLCILCEPDPYIVHSDHWTIRLNAWPYPDTRLHLLISPVSHVADIGNLALLERIDFWRALGMARKAYGIEDYEIRWRSGDPRRTGGTIAHTHAHVIVRARR